jgi:hypothetical protein
MKKLLLPLFLLLGLNAFSINYYVDSTAAGTHDGKTWATAYDSLQPALKIASSGDTIFIARGTYLPTNTTDRAKFFSLPSGVRLMGGYPSGGGDRDIDQYKTVLSANIGSATADTDNTYHVIFCYMSAPGTEINGLSITGGYADGSGDNANGGGIYVRDKTSRYYHVTIKDCMVYKNYAAGGGGGINITQKGDIYNCVIRDNHSKGGGGGVMLIDDARAHNTLIINNYSETYGGGVYLKGFNSAPGLFGCVIANNQTPGDGAGIFQVHDGRVYNCTVARNKGKTGYYYGIYSQVANNVVWGNAGSQISPGRLSDLHHCAIGDPSTDFSSYHHSITLDSINTGYSDTLHYAAFGNPSDSIGNVSTPEGRQNIFNADWYLNPGSACIDSGSNDYKPDPPLAQDFYQSPRYTDSIIDIGAAEAILNLSTDSALVYGDSVRFFGTVLFSPDSNKTARGFSYGVNSASMTDIAADSGTGSYSAWPGHALTPATYYYRTWSNVGNNRYPGLIKTFIICSTDTTKENVKICNGENYTFPDGNTLDNITSDTAYISHLKAINGCDSLVTTLVAVNHVDTLVALHGDTLVAHASTAQYQWLDCNNGHTAISGATAQSFTPQQNGNYAVEITQNSCVDTSSCHAITTVGIAENIFKEGISLYPNPAKNQLSVNFYLPESSSIRVDVLNVCGHLVMQPVKTSGPRGSSKIKVDISKLPAGYYFVRIRTKYGVQIRKVVVH